MLNILKLDGSFNTRDIGGYYNESWSQLKKGLLYRSDKLNNLSDSDVAIIKELGVERIIDLRCDNERKKTPNRIIEGVEYINHPIFSNKDFSKDIDNILDGNLMIDDLFKDLYRDFVLHYTDRFAEILKKIMMDKKITIFHCTSGKDRTGFLTMLILLILEVKTEVIVFDYLESNKVDNIELIMNNMSSVLDVPYEKMEILKPLFYVDTKYISKSLNTINDVYGSLPNYLNSFGINTSMHNEFKTYMLS